MSSIKTVKNDRLDEAYDIIEHNSGLTIYVMNKKNIKSCYAVFGTNYGSVDTCFSIDGSEEKSVPEGIAHFLEHKLFESEELDAFERYAKTGAYANAYTSFDKTCYLFSCSDHFDENLEILLDFVKHPYFTKETVQKEQGIIGQEIQMYQDNPDWQVLFNLLRALYKTNPVRIDIAGTKESIARIDHTLLYDCYNAFYNNSNMVLAVAGNVTTEKVLEICDRLLKKEDRKEIKRVVPFEDETISQNYISEKMNVEMPKFSIGYREKPFEKTDLKFITCVNMAFSLICGKTTEFYSELMNEGLINSSFGYEYFAGRGFAVNVFSGESKEPMKVKEKIAERIKSVKENGVDFQQFEAIRRQRYGEEIKCYNDLEALATGLLSMHFEKYNMFDIFEVYRTLTKEDIEDVIAQCFDEKMCAISVIE